MLHDTAQRWVHEWRSACDVCISFCTLLRQTQKFQELDEDRIDFMKANIWNYANLYSAICVSEDDVGRLRDTFTDSIVLREDSTCAREY